MIRRFDTLFARLFGGALLAILLAHLLAFIWFTQYGMRPPPDDRPDAQHSQDDQGRRHRPPPGGPLVLLFFQFVTLIVAAWYGAKALSRPVQRLSEAAERLSEDLDSPPLEISGPQEARQAAQTFNLMQRKIREQMQQRGRMLAAVSHDLRTPLSRLKLRVEQIEEPRLHGQMTQDLNDMISMLDATLAYLNEHRRSEALQQFDLQALIESQAENAQDNGDDVQYQGQCKPLRTQPMALRSCLQNLVDNALRYAGSVDIVIEDSAERVRISVVDHGPGIAPEFHEAVFEPFYRLEGSRNRNSGGIGMGMSIAREAARRIGGELTLAQTPGGGLTAILNLPRL
ncbi:Sensor histidine kinase [Pseudomonas amygdali pv. eriobotryae]|uniref:histidine kinase n=1 Tax=Pseudomonas amygdali pv. eriobotryae TaxID=129137 RepID=A0A0P9Q9X0_PSEA0|nr:HAMP domain-containing sensor histidine kinase [Pseudomonas amygdali]KPX27504.1 Sensor histidine kinase [Pseudomonas amygdali pv. eriobotryae]KWS79300.1 histidine kinase [Pseudomonas amygdali pv. eriobotryae]RML97604.1 Sensor histidine kinase [Pseudomonas amygdali pv. eriobotryae]RMO60595.1 Sensor histidine kinase [Pseudomonas amygdali pv. eriobotryae]GFZ57519.1 two-component sensor histidine kinase [Pseudomonas amygdali pv. eriobotryae]